MKFENTVLKQVILKVISGKNCRKKVGILQFKLNGLHKDNPLAWEKSNPARVGVQRSEYCINDKASCRKFKKVYPFSYNRIGI